MLVFPVYEKRLLPSVFYLKLFPKDAELQKVRDWKAPPNIIKSTPTAKSRVT